jgi:para-nitrobenzyl esterase
MTRFLSCIAAGLLFAPTATFATPSGRPQASSEFVRKDASVHYLVGETVIELIIDDPKAKAVMDKHLPGLSDSEQIGLAGGLTLKDLQNYLPQIVTAEKLAAIQADFNTF